MDKKKILFVLLLLLSVGEIISASPSIKGKIVELGSKSPIEFGDIVLLAKDSEKEITSALPQKDGLFLLSGMKGGEYRLLIRALGFQTFSRENIVLKDDNAVLDLGIIELEPAEFALKEIEVTGRKRQIVYKLDKKVIEAGNNILAGGGTAVDILENTPSIRINAEGEVSFRGSSGFTVYIDGKPGLLSGSDALEQIPAALIDNIEIITTPAARHETGGDVGIINVITKKHTGEGLSGMLNLTGSTVLSHNLNFLLTKQIDKSRWHIGGSFYNRYRKSDFDQEKTTIVADTSTTSHSTGPRRSNFYNYTLRGGWRYALPKTTFDIEAEGGYYGKARRGELDYIEERTENGKFFEKGDYISYDDYDNYKKFIKGTTGFDHQFAQKGHKLSGMFFLIYDWKSVEYFQSDLFDKQGERQQGHRAWEAEYHVTAKANLDYVYPYSETGHFEAGYQFYSYLEDGDYSMQFWNPQQKEFYWRDDIYNTFYFQRGIHSVYSIWGEHWKNFEFQVGLRGEHTHRVLGSSKDWANRVVNRFEVFPSTHFGYHLPNEDIVTAAYSRRTTRPDLFYMEPYITFRDYYSAEIGNPDIRPEYINSYELNYKKSIDNRHTVSATTFYRNRKDKIERLRIPYEAGVTLDSMANVGHDYSLGLELFSEIQIAHWWELSANGSYYRYQVKNELKETGGADEGSNNYEISLGNRFEWKNFRFQLDGFMVGPSVTTQGKTDAFRYINFGVRKQLFNKKLAATLSFRDVFNTARYRSDINTSNLQSITHIRPKYPLIMLTLNYTFNNYKTNQTKEKADHDIFEGTNH
jgi:outer membrane receptor protein involved in Fe transport